MSVSHYTGQLERKRKSLLEANKKVGEYRTKESAKRTEADKARQAAATATSDSTARSKLQDADRKTKEAETASKEAARWQTKATTYARDEADLMGKLTRAHATESAATARRIENDQRRADQQLRSQRHATESRIQHIEHVAVEALSEVRAPKPEKLRVLILGASGAGDLRVTREQKRIRTAVNSALHRDLVELGVRPAATASDLLDGITRFRPHVVHFSGHSNADLILFEDDVDEPHHGVVVTAHAFSRAIAATDEPPLLVVLNSCGSAAQIDDLVDRVVPFAIGMTDEIGDVDAISYAAQFYSAVADGQSIEASHRAGQAALELAGLDSANVPRLACATGTDPSKAVLVQPPFPAS